MSSAPSGEHAEGSIGAPPRTPRRRRDEFFGILIAAIGLLLLAALLTYHPNDPSLFNSVSDPEALPRNWAGRVGASYAAGSFQFFGLASFVFPAAILLFGIRRFLSRPAAAWGTKALGLITIVLAIGPLFHIVIRRPAFLGGGVSAGGHVGEILGCGLVAALNTPGAVLFLLVALLMGFLLATALSLGDIASGLAGRVSERWQLYARERERRPGTTGVVKTSCPPGARTAKPRPRSRKMRQSAAT